MKARRFRSNPSHARPADARRRQHLPSVKIRSAIFGLATALSLTAAAPNPAAFERLPDPARPGFARAVKVPDAPLVFTGLVHPSSPAADARRQFDEVIDRLGELLAAAGSDLEQVVRLNFHVADDAATQAVEAGLAARFGRHPAAITVQRSVLAVAGARIAGDAVGRSSRATRTPEKVGDAMILPAGGKVFVSGQAKQGGTFAESVRLTMAGLHQALEKVGATPADVVQVKAFIKPMTQHSTARAEIERSYAGGRVPPIVITEWLTGSDTEIELIAAGANRPARDPADPIEFHWLPGMSVSPYFSRLSTVAPGSPLLFLGCIDGGTGGSARDQWLRAFQQLAHVLRDAGSSFRHLAKATYFLADPTAREYLAEIRSVVFDPARPPAASGVDVQGLGWPGRSVGVDIIAVPMQRAPAPPAGGAKQAK